MTVVLTILSCAIGLPVLLWAIETRIEAAVRRDRRRRAARHAHRAERLHVHLSTRR